MNNSHLKSITNTVKNWYIPLVVGILFIVVGILAFSLPEATYLTLSLLFSVSFLIAGIFETVFSIANRKHMDNWGWSLFFGLATFIFGFVMTLQPELSMLMLAAFVGFTLLFRSIAAISFSIDIKSYGVSQWGLLLALGIVGIILSFILIIDPKIAGATIVAWTGLTFIAVGVFNIFLSLQLRKVKQISKGISKDLKDRFEAISKEIKEELFD